ncbi:MAG: YhcH/YjgK/YiaL family protein [Bacteroidia bacterium]|nr:YhcH/YjgK/YiaL family protein [Bacteroidia bacterium]
MIIDRIENATRYYALGSEIAEALEYIKNNDLSSIASGSYEISKGKVRMIVNEYAQNCTDRVRMEAHRKNIDVQYWVSGSELMGYAPLQTQKVLEPYNEEKDCGHYAADASFSKLEPGMFAIYFPTDLHTAVADEQCDSKVRKIVFKVVVE